MDFTISDKHTLGENIHISNLANFDFLEENSTFAPVWSLDEDAYRRR